MKEINVKLTIQEIKMIRNLTENAFTYNEKSNISKIRISLYVKIMKAIEQSIKENILKEKDE